MKKLTQKTIAITLAASLLIQSFMPQKLFAMNGPNSPEFSSFEPIGSTGMVNDFTGSFSYNIPVIEIPGPDGGGYALNLSYSSDLSPESDASWVGYGWNLSPGAIVRGKQGFPDDVSAGSVTKFNKAPSDLTASVSVATTAEAISLDILPASLSATAMYNSYNGLTVSAVSSVGLSAYGLSMSASLTTTGDHSFNAQVSPADWFKRKNTEAYDNSMLAISSKEGSSFDNAFEKHIQAQGNYNDMVGSFGSNYSSYTLGNQSRSTYVSGYDGFSISLSVDAQAAPLPIPVGIGAKFTGSLSMHFPIESEEMEYYGYMYSHNAEKGDNILMDYSVEKESPYNERDYYLGIPYSAADNFMVMGEGIGGSFRAYSKTPGHFRANTRTSTTVFGTAGADAMLGLDVGAGSSYSLGSQVLTSDEWYDGDDFRFNNDGDESYYFMFNGDMGSSVDYGGMDTVKFEPSGSDLAGWEVTAPANSRLYNLPNNSEERPTRSSYIGYHTNAEMLLEDDNNNYFKRYNYRSDIENFADRSSSDPNQIGEFTVSNTDGNNYVYGLPVYVKREKNVSVNIEPSVGNYIIHENLEVNNASDNIDIENLSEDITTLIGEEMADGEKYANTWLLTQITSPNYIDINHNGPDDEDYGGWTIFNYSKYYGDNTAIGWYKYRTPYTGLFNNPGRLSDSKDDMGSYSSGYKEMYYVESIETKTHRAVFTLSPRQDGYDANHDDDEATSNNSAMGNNPLQKLDKIELYAKESNELLQTIHFEYDYSIFPGQPNSDDGSGNKTGKLTLTRVYVEYANVKSDQISPYEFLYEYPITDYPSQYDELENYGSLLIQTPDYNALDCDRWGYYQANGEDRYNMMNPWVDQSPASDFDPAAGLLKQIILPSGGEIYVQYEQNEYLYVQDKKALAMVNFTQIGAYEGNTLQGEEASIYYLNTDELGITTDEEKDALVSLIQTKYIDTGERLYFKFLYNISGADAVLANGDCALDWIDGYVKVKTVGRDENENNNVYIQLGDNSENSEAYDVPREVCVDFYNQTRAGKIDLNGGSCEDANLDSDDISDDGSGAESFLRELIAVFEDAAEFLNVTDAICAYIDEENSYLRIPLPDTNAKKGGGVRVKRIITYDNGLEGDGSDATVYGQEYIYLTTDSTSSGVATNEPMEGGDENALVTYLDKRQDSDWAQRIISGRDKEQFEGPIGANILPSPSIGYSRIVTRSLFDGYSHAPQIIKEFYTCKDYPVQVENTELKKETSWIPVPAYPVSSNITKVWATQGYSMIVNNMHGQPKREATYAGNYNTINNNLLLVSEKSYNYLEPGTAVNAISEWNWNNGGSFETETFVPGQHTEVVMESREVVDVTIDATVEFDVSIGIFGIVVIPYASVMPYLNYVEDNLRTHVTNKITFFPAILESVTATQDGIAISTNNEYFNKATGSAIVSSVNDGYNGLVLNNGEHNGMYYNFSFPASHFYADMGTKGSNEQMYIESTNDLSMLKLVTDNDGDNIGDGFYLSLSGSEVCNNLDKFTSGSLIALYDNDTRSNPDIYNVGEISGGVIELLPTNYFYYNNAANGSSSPDGVNVEILRSGKTNQLSAGVGSLSSYGGLPTASLHTISEEDRQGRDALIEVLNAELSGSASVSLSSSEIAALANLGIINPVTGECSVFSEVYPSDLSDAATSSGQQATSSSTSGFQISVSTVATSYSYTLEICDTLPSVLVNCDQVGGVMVCDTLPEKVICRDEIRNYTCDQLIVGFNNSQEAGDGIDNDGDGAIDESDEGTDECETVLQYTPHYRFFLDNETFEIMYGDPENSCDATRIECIDFCPDQFAYTTLDKIVAASASSLSDNWTYNSYIKDGYSVSLTDNVYETGEQGRWNLESVYGYNTTVNNITENSAYTYNTAILDEFTFFNWEYNEANDSTNWLKANTIEYYTPNGVPVQEKNILEIKSCAKYGYQKTLPYIIAANAYYSTIFFESFENASSNGLGLEFEDGFTINNSSYNYGYYNSSQWNANESHSGSKSYQLGFRDDANTPKVDYKSQLRLKPIELTDQLYDDGLLLQFWMKTNDLDVAMESIQLKIANALNSSNSISVDFDQVARVGEWTLYSAETGALVYGQWPGVSAITPTIYMVHDDADAAVFIDDVRVQPLTAQVSSYVYDPDNLRLLTVFDDQLFGLYYQYNDEGKLIRKLVETERGTKTIAETLYHTPTVAK